MDSRPTFPHLSQRYGPWALVTGASDGIGREFARCMAASGLNLVLVARRESQLQDLAGDLTARHGIAIQVLPADLATAAGLAAVRDQTANLEIGLLVAAAGFGTSGPFVDGDLDAEMDMLNVNCRAVTALCHTFARRFIARNRGGIVLLSSLVGFQGVPRAAHYAATKGYVQTLAEGLHRELLPHGVDVVAAAPGPIHSGFAERAAMTMALAQTPEAVAGATLRALGRRLTVRPGWLSQVLHGALAPLPRWARVRVMVRVMAGMTPR